MSREYPARNYFVLNAVRPADSPRLINLTDAYLRINRFQISPRFARKGFAYRIGEDKYELDFYNNFFVAPQDMITEECRQWFDQPDETVTAIGSGSRISTTHSLEAWISELYGDYHGTQTPDAVLTISIFLLEDRADKRKPVFAKTYSERIPIDSREPAALVAGWNTALRKIYTLLERDIAENSAISKTNGE